MKVLATYASKYGATREVADRIAATLRGYGMEADVRPAKDKPDVAAYDAVILGSAVFASSWMKEAADFAASNAAPLSERPVWLFSVGLAGTQTGRLGRLNWPEPKQVAPLRETIHPRDYRFFTGALRARSLDPLKRLFFKLARVTYGDFRDWDAIEAWAHEIAKDLMPAGQDSE